MFESKRVFWQFEVEGAQDEARELEQMVNDIVDEFNESSKIVRRTVLRVRTT